MTDKIRQEGAEKDDLVWDQPQKPLEDKKLTKYANYHGAYEVEAAKRGKALFTPLHISDNTAKQVPGYQAFSEQYELYKVPAHHASTALGRVNDLHASGAPRTPADIPAKTMKHFQKVDNVGTSTNEKLKAQSANQWIEQQDELHSTFDGYMAGREAMSGAMSEWRSVQELLRQRRLTAQKNGAQGEKDKIDRAADTLVEITKVSAEAFTMMTALEAEFMEGVSETYTATAEIEEGKVIQTAEVGRKLQYEKALEVAKKAGGQIGLKELFIIGMGDYKKYQELQRKIADLNNQIAESHWAEEQHHIAAAEQKLGNVKLEIKGRQRAFEGKRGDARNAAQAFGQATNGKEASIMVCMMAEAYQELDLFGSRAKEEADQLKPRLQPVWNWLNDHVEKYKIERRDDFSDYAEDYRTLGGAAVDSIKSRELLHTEEPKWHGAAKAWKHFLSDVMDKRFDPQEADADVQQGVKPRT